MNFGKQEQGSKGRLWPLVVWGAGDLYFILSVIIAILFGILSPDLQKELHLSSGEVGVLGSVFFLSYGIAQFMAGALMDAIGPRWTLAGSGVLATVGLFLLSTAGSLSQACIAQLLLGVGLSTSYVGAIYLAGLWFPPQKFSLLSGVTQTSASLVSTVLILGMALSGALVSFRTIMGIAAVVVLVTALLMALVVHRPEGEVQAKGASGKARLHILDDLKKLMRIPQFWAATGFFSVTFGVLMAFSNLWNIPSILAYGHTLKLAAEMGAMIPLGCAFGAISAGWLAGKSAHPSRVARYFLVGMIILGAALVYGPVYSDPVIFGVIFGWGFFLGGSVLGFPLVSQHLEDSLKGTGFGLMASIAYIVSAVLQLIIGLLLEPVPSPGPALIQDFKFALTTLMVTLVAGFFASFWLEDRKDSTRPHS